MHQTAPASVATRKSDVPETRKVEFIPVEQLKLNPANSRTHSKHQINLIAQSIDRFGFVNPVLIDTQNKIIAGHGRLAAARKLGHLKIPALRIEHLTEADFRAYAIAENRLAELAGWDPQILSIELHGLIEFGYDVELTGFAQAEIDLILEEAAGRIDDAHSGDDIEPILGSRAVSRPDDIWQLGEHRLLCGDALDNNAYRHLLGGSKADVVFTDPPYNVPVHGHVSGKGQLRHREFAMASGEMSSVEFETFLRQVLNNAAGASRDGAVHFVCMDWRHLRELLAASAPVYSSHLNFCVWAKTNGGMGSLYRSQHELVLVFKVGTAPHRNNVELGRHGRNRTNLWTYPGVNTFRLGRSEDLALHPTVKPIALVADAIQDVSKRRDLVLDPFVGSGTTIVAAEKIGRRAACMELDPLYVDAAIRRWQRFTGKDAVLADTKITFDERADQVEGKNGRPEV
jgi:DNA modification methylase